MKKTTVILDTDIGDDIDDALALGLICACPELDLSGVTTVFGNVTARARQARTILKDAGSQFSKVPVAAGCGASMASRPIHGSTAYLEDELPNQDSSCLPEEELPPLDKRHGVNVLVESIMNGRGDILPVTIGALTNLAAAMVMERRIVQKIPRVVAMAAEFKQPFAEYNIRCDPEAAHIVFSSGIPIDVITWDIGHTVRFGPEQVDRLAQGTSPLARRLSLMISTWQNAHEVPQDSMPSLYDPMAVATMVQPDLCTWKTGVISVELKGEATYGFTTFREDPEGPHRVAWDADRERSLDFFLQRILGT